MIGAPKLSDEDMKDVVTFMVEGAINRLPEPIRHDDRDIAMRRAAELMLRLKWP
jgi:hypothetical protein